MPDLEPITRDEKLWSGEDLEPITRREMYIKHLYDETQVIPDKPITREEMFILKAGEELHDVTIEQLTATENRTYSEEGVAYSPVIVNVPQPTLTTLDVTENGTYTAPSGTAYDEVEVDVPLPDNAYLLKEIEDVEIATFTDGSALPMPKLEVTVEPVQEGSGDPSPTNIRPISGWTEANVTRAGKNLVDISKLGLYVSTSTGGERVGVPVYLSQGTYTISKESGDTILYLTNIDNDYSFQQITLPFTFTVETSTHYLIRIGTDAISSWDITNLQVEEGSTATTYEPYNGQTYTIQLGDTYYGGKLDVVSGVLKDAFENGIIDIGEQTFTYNSTSKTFYLRLLNSKEYTSAEVANAVSSAFKCVANNAMSDLTLDNCFSIHKEAGSVWLNIRCLTYSDANSFVNAMSGQTLMYEVASPTTIQLTPTQVNSLEGVNNIFANSGEIINGQYFSKGGITI